MGRILSGRPQSLEERTEFASDYWGALTAWLERNFHELHTAVRGVYLTRRLDDTFEYILNGCTTIILLAFSGPFVILTIPLYFYGVAVALQQQAFQAALLDFFSDSGYCQEVSDE